MIGYVAAGHKRDSPERKITGITRSTANTRRTPAAGLELRSGYAFPTFQTGGGILVLIDATL
jgi:hypothetical protein